MTAMQRTKGKTGEREIASLIRDLTGWDVRRRVRQHDGDVDLEGIPGWAPEVKRHRRGTRGDIAAWWSQAVEQARAALPVLFYRLDRDTWRAVWPLTVLVSEQRANYWRDYAWTAETSIEAWAAVAGEVVGQRSLLSNPASAVALQGAPAPARQPAPELSSVEGRADHHSTASLDRSVSSVRST